MNIRSVAYRLTNAKSEEARMQAWSELKAIRDYIDDLIEKYQKLDRDWTKEIRSKR